VTEMVFKQSAAHYVKDTNSSGRRTNHL
jgi:hypothetical protein